LFVRTIASQDTAVQATEGKPHAWPGLIS